ncbi:MAG: hypothetical protein ACI9YE_003108 [Psychroserpens sp.]|jgi:hypothetical protein
MDEIPTSKWIRSLEAFLELCFKLLGIYIVYFAINWLGKELFASNFRQDTLLSLLLLPAIYILRDVLIIFEPFFAVVNKSESQVTVRSGITPRVIDTLNIASVDNIEIVRTPFGYCFNYASIRLYGRGGSVDMPYVINAEEVSKTINICDTKLIQK